MARLPLPDDPHINCSRADLLNLAIDRRTLALVIFGELRVAAEDGEELEILEHLAGIGELALSPIITTGEAHVARAGKGTTRHPEPIIGEAAEDSEQREGDGGSSDNDNDALLTLLAVLPGRNPAWCSGIANLAERFRRRQTRCCLTVAWRWIF